MKPPRMFAIVHQGVARGLLIPAIIPQSKVRRDKPAPEVYPKSRFTCLSQI